MGKLVRDRIPEKLNKAGVTFTSIILSNDLEFEQSLLEKIVEESIELQRASTREEQIEELADILEVISAYMKQKGIGTEEVSKARLLKRIDKGGFKKRIFLVSYEEDNEAPVQ